jgi:hypothetical protein
MNPCLGSWHFVIRNGFALSVVMVALSSSVGLGVVAQPLTAPDAAAKEWLFIVDGGDYAKSWDRTGGLFKARLTTQDWQSKIAPVREPLGAIMQRKLAGVTFANTGAGLPTGKYAVVRFNSSFANKAVAEETVGLDLENGRWAVTGYFIK